MDDGIYLEIVAVNNGEKIHTDKYISTNELTLSLTNSMCDTIEELMKSQFDVKE